MDWQSEVQAKMKRGNQILFAKDSAFLEALSGMLRTQSHLVQVLWALEFAQEIADDLQLRYPGEERPNNAVQLSWAWAEGKVKMPMAQRAILQVHALAKEIDSARDIALCHAIGQACGVVHTPGHAMGLPMYELTALVRHYGIANCEEAVLARREEYITRLAYWAEHAQDDTRTWAKFVKQ